MKTYMFLSSCFIVIGIILVGVSLNSIKRCLAKHSDQILTQEISDMILQKYTLMVIGGSIVSISGIVIILLR